jgi:GrpB-like predicted nucleotidyltransferase (UPF0157 family)
MEQLDKLSDKELGKLFPIIISEPQTDWGILFNKEKEEIESILGIDNIISLEHIGSTAVPDLPSKPIIDILLQISDSADNEFIKQCLNKVGYHYIYKPENPPPHMMFVRGYTPYGYKGQAFHLHIRYRGDWDEIYFRDFLIKKPEIAHEYAKLKIQLANEYKYDREGYTESKTEFIKRINSIAKNSANASR